ncbi:MAG: radical SAM protein [Proteobacteria bacterium]|nr:radical SAM protein [Pseudomonadota bacterium]MBU1583211.1 radical SAM protein [Pseudomonadota bacterium]MBU2452357.1 radical SAM protein [Pseudomonadota bacterium]MBU2627660.1 radical SAM protein [Pseudomonadota bacterium]
MKPFVPKFIKAKQQGLLHEKIQQSTALLSSCTLCPRQCKVDRTKNEKGFCSTGEKAVVASFAPHFGEEPQLVGDKGSGTIFFTHCNLKCVFCQNYDISVNGMGQEADDGQIAAIMLYLQKIGCHNINLVTPSHVVPQILRALDIAAGQGLNIPLVYNCSGYESIDTLYILKDVIDIYMPDFKFWDPVVCEMCCHAQDYPQVVRKAIKLMHDQVGDLKVDKNGIACSGLIVRHLVMPENLAGTHHILKFLKEKISSHTHVNVMSQYRPMGDAGKIKALSRSLTTEEFQKALKMARDLNLKIIQ